MKENAKLSTVCPLKVILHFRGTSVKRVAYRVYFTCYLLHVDFLGLLFDSDEGGAIFLQNVR